MRSKIFVGIIFLCLFVTSVFGEPLTEIQFIANDLGLDRWEYVYTVKNVGLTEGIDEFTVWFGVGSYDNLVIETLDPPASNWDEIVWQPEPFLGDDGGYDALATGLNIGIGESVSGFAVSFDWLGAGSPGSQYYEIINPMDFSTIETGWTTPEPSTLMLFGFSGLVLLNKYRKQNSYFKKRK